MGESNSMTDFEFLDVDDDLECSENLPKSSTEEDGNGVGSAVSLIISTLSAISETQGFYIKFPIKTFAATAVATLTGSLIGGLPGLALGVIASSIISRRKSKQKKGGNSLSDDTISLNQIFGEMSAQQKKDLFKELVKYTKQPNIKVLARELWKNERIKSMAFKFLTDFLLQKMGLNLVQIQETVKNTQTQAKKQSEN